MEYLMKLFFLILTLVILSVGNKEVFPTGLVKPLVDTDWVAKNLDHLAIIDVRSESHSFYKNPVYEKNTKTGKWDLVKLGGHIPGAQLVLYEKVRGKKIIKGKEVNYILPGKTAFEELMQNAGINQNSHIVVVTNAEDIYDITMASRMYWQIKYYGHDDVSILDGGTAQWLIDGRDVSTILENTPKGNWQASDINMSLLASSDEVLAAIDKESIQIVDVRSLGQYLGTYKSSKVSEKGHIPTAKLYPIDLVTTRYTPIRFSSKSDLSQLTNALNIDTDNETITYCNSGHMASGAWFAFYELLGMKNSKLYDGSMHQWTIEKRPVVRMKIE